MRSKATVLLIALTIASCAKTGTVAPRVRPPVVRAHAVIPAPESIEMALAAPPFVVTAQTSIVVPAGDEGAAAVGRFLADWIGLAAAELPPRVQPAGAAVVTAGQIVLTLDAASGDEGYDLSIAADGIRIAAAQPAGLFYGVQTLRQLL